MPRLTLSKKIFLALATLLVVLLLIFTAFSIVGLQRGLGPYVAEVEMRRMDWLAQVLQKHYAAQGNWDRLRSEPETWLRIRTGDPGLAADTRDAIDRRLPPWYARGEAGGPFEGRMPLPPMDLLARRFGPPPPWMVGGPDSPPDSVYQRLGVIDNAGRRVVGPEGDIASMARMPLKVDGKPVGQLVLAPPQGLESEADRAFLTRQSGIIALTGLAGLVVALVLSWFLARRWFGAIDDLAQAAQKLAGGRLDTRVAVRGSDELAFLSRTFNDMAERLDTIEASRRAWLADVAHELRTPLAAMRAEIEALQDGVRSFDDRTALRLHRQVMRLSQLVDDLRSSMRESVPPSPARAPAYPLALLRDALALTRDRFAQRGIDVDATALEALAARTTPAPTLQGDARALHQVFLNLLENTLRYTDAPGRLRLDARIEHDVASGGDALHLGFEDSAPGPGAAELPRLFDRLFRGEGSRNRASGGSGLGLSICRATVQAHGGRIGAQAAALGGLRIDLVLPLEGAP